MTAHSLSTLTRPRPNGDAFTLDVPDGWQQGRGCFGGLTLSALVRACEQFEREPERTLRSVSGHIVGPVLPGAVEIRVERLRSGSGVSTLAASLRQSGETLVHAVCLFGKRRVDDGDWLELMPPARADWRVIEPLPVGPPFGPVFAQHMEFRSVGAMAFSGDTTKPVEGFLREKHPGPARDAAMLVALVDAWWPVAVSRMTSPRPMATVAFTCQLLGDLATVPVDEPVYHRGRADAASDGYTVEMRELWTTTGRLLALNQQTIAIIK